MYKDSGVNITLFKSLLIELYVIYRHTSFIKFNNNLKNNSFLNSTAVLEDNSVPLSRIYYPFIEVNSSRFFHIGDANLEFGGDIFVPVWQTPAANLGKRSEG